MTKKKQIIVSAPGKIHLLGEHAVVYGYPALLTTVDRRCTVTLTQMEISTIVITAENLQKTMHISSEQIIGKRTQAQMKWEEYRKNSDIATLKLITADEMDFAVIAIGETLHYFHQEIPSGFSLSIKSDIPIGAGLGSSAATAVAIVAVVASFLGKDIEKSKQIINDIAFLVEQKKHGLPSGGDNATVCFGGLVWFRKETPDLKIIQSVPFSVPETIAQNFTIIDTGRPVESTGEMVTNVRLQREKDRNKIASLFNDQEQLVRELLSAIKNGDEEELLRIIKQGENNLETLGVVSSSSQKLIREIEGAGGAAKICGGGGIEKATGVVLAYHNDRSKIKKIVEQYKLPLYDAILGVEGLREE